MFQITAQRLSACLILLIVATFAAFLILISSNTFLQGSLYQDVTLKQAFPFYDLKLYGVAIDHPSPGREKQWPFAVSPYLFSAAKFCFSSAFGLL